MLGFYLAFLWPGLMMCSKKSLGLSSLCSILVLGLGFWCRFACHGGEVDESDPEAATVELHHRATMDSLSPNNSSPDSKYLKVIFEMFVIVIVQCSHVMHNLHRLHWSLKWHNLTLWSSTPLLSYPTTPRGSQKTQRTLAARRTKCVLHGC